MKTVHFINQNPLSFEILEKFLEGNVEIKLSDESKGLIQKCRDYLDNKVKNQQEAIYGITTSPPLNTSPAMD